MEETFTTRPRPLDTIDGNTSWVIRVVLTILTSIMFRWSPVASSVKYCGYGGQMPTLFTRMKMSFVDASRDFSIFSYMSGEVKSTASVRIWILDASFLVDTSASILFRVLLSFSSLRLKRRRLYPLIASWRANSNLQMQAYKATLRKGHQSKEIYNKTNPIPSVAPVTTAHWSPVSQMNLFRDQRPQSRKYTRMKIKRAHKVTIAVSIM